MATVAPARILVVDDHPIVRLGVRQMISSDPSLAVCGEADSMDKAIELAHSLRPDLAIVDLSLTDGAGLELVRLFHETFPELPVLVLSMHDEQLFAERAIRAGARGYIMKHEAIVGLVHAIQQVLSGQIWLSERMSQALLERVSGDRVVSGGRLGNLTDRELEVFELIGRGMGTSAIADRLGISVKTIETYRANIKSKLDLRDARELIRYAATWGSGAISKS